MSSHDDDITLEYAHADTDVGPAGRWLRWIVGGMVILCGLMFGASFATQAPMRWRILLEAFDPATPAIYQREPVREVALWTFYSASTLAIGPAFLLISGRRLRGTFLALRILLAVAAVSAPLIYWNTFARARTPLTWDRYVAYLPTCMERSYLPIALLLLTYGPTGRQMRGSK